MNQVSSVAFGTDANVFQGYAESANDRLGAIDFVFENTGPNAAYIRLAQYDGATSPSGFATIDTSYTVSPFTANFLGFAVAPGGTVTRHYTLVSKRVAFFGSGNTIVNISAVLRNKSDLRGALSTSPSTSSTCGSWRAFSRAISATRSGRDSR